MAMPRIRIPRPFAGALVLMLAVSCQNPVCGCTPASERAVLYGRVTDGAGNPVASALVRAEGGSAGGRHTGSVGSDAADAGGRYRAELRRFAGSMECLCAFALPPSGSALRGSDTVHLQVRFDAPRATDSVRVDLVLRAA
ncbi:MAG TPA: hypothetical protein VF006_24415 [Longimicrobium sp.]